MFQILKQFQSLHANSSRFCPVYGASKAQNKLVVAFVCSLIFPHLHECVKIQRCAYIFIYEQTIVIFTCLP